MNKQRKQYAIEHRVRKCETPSVGRKEGHKQATQWCLELKYIRLLLTIYLQCNTTFIYANRGILLNKVQNGI